jgi:uncharacterized protein YuzE
MKISFDPDADVLAIQFVKKGRLFDTQHSGSTIVHFDKKGKILYIEFLNASRLIAEMVKAAVLAKQAA